MSSYCQMTQHPTTKKWEMASWMDDFFGIHLYGVRFKSGEIFNPQDWILKTKEKFGALKDIEKFNKKFKGRRFTVVCKAPSKSIQRRLKASEIKW